MRIRVRSIHRLLAFSKAAVPPEQLHDCYLLHYLPWWHEDVPFIHELKEAAVYECRADAEDLVRVSDWLPETE